MIDARRIAAISLCILAFFPFIGGVPGIDVQPNFLLVAALVALFSCSHIKINTGGFAVLLFWLGACMARVLVDVQEVVGFYFLSFIASLITPVLVWYLVKYERLTISLAMLKMFLIIYLIVAFVQRYAYPEFLAFLVQRDNVDMLLESGRGVRSLTPEPATFGRILLAINLLFVFLMVVNKSYAFALKSFAVTLVLVLFNYLLSQSFYAVAFHAFFCLGLLLCLRFWYSVLAMLIFAMFFSALMSVLLSNADEGGRFYYILNALLNDFNVIINQGAFSRVMNVPISVYGGLVHGPFGAGLAPEMVYSTFNIFGHPYDFVVGSRNLGGVVEFFLRLGVLSLPILIFYFVALIRIAKFNYFFCGRRYRIGLCLASGLLLVGFFDGSPANPIVWFVTFYIYMYVVRFEGALADRRNRDVSRRLQGSY